MNRRPHFKTAIGLLVASPALVVACTAAPTAAPSTLTPAPPTATQPPPTATAPLPTDTPALSATTLAPPTEAPARVTDTPIAPTATEEPAAGLDGQALVQERCDDCHGLARVESARKAEADWASTVQRMVRLGAQLTDEEQEAVVRYLAEAFPN
jgi:mono/diheme cytochrome c family protein